MARETRKSASMNQAARKFLLCSASTAGVCQATQRVNSQLFITGITARKYVLVLSAAVRHHLEKAQINTENVFL